MSVYCILLYFAVLAVCLMTGDARSFSVQPVFTKDGSGLRTLPSPVYGRLTATEATGKFSASIKFL